MIMTALKECTRALHEQIEVRVGLLDRLESMDSYRRLLERFLGFYDPIELQLAMLSLTELNFSSRRKTEKLRGDLADLGISSTHMAALPRCEDLPAVNNPAQALGCLYVLEGATLGGQIIARELRTRFGLHENHGASFFNGYGSETGRMWREFGATINKCVSIQETEEFTIHSARDTFITLDRWLAEH